MELIKQMTQEDINFKAELEILINKHSQENKSNTPDFILCEYILNCLGAWERAIERRDKWYGDKRLEDKEDKAE
jgi:hypothetical protein